MYIFIGLSYKYEEESECRGGVLNADAAVHKLLLTAYSGSAVYLCARDDIIRL